MKTIVPIKMIVELNDDSTFKTGVLKYQIQVDGVMSNKFYTMGIDNGITLTNINSVLQEAKAHTEQGEGIS